MKQSLFDLMIGSSFRIHPGNHNNIQTSVQLFFVQPITFSDQTGKTMSYHTVSDFFADWNAKSVFFRFIFLYEASFKKEERRELEKEGGGKRRGEGKKMKEGVKGEGRGGK